MEQNFDPNQIQNRFQNNQWFQLNEQEFQDQIRLILQPQQIDQDDDENLFQKNMQQAQGPTSSISNQNIPCNQGHSNQHLQVNQRTSPNVIFSFQENSISSYSQKQLKEKKQQKRAETKNIPKNVGKRIAIYYESNRLKITQLLKTINSQFTYDEILRELKKREKKKLNQISSLRDLWIKQTPYSKQMRIISNQFLRKQGFHWIFNSKVQTYGIHIKYRRVLLNQIKNPQGFVNLKFNY